MCTNDSNDINNEGLLSNYYVLDPFPPYLLLVLSNKQDLNVILNEHLLCMGCRSRQEWQTLYLK